MKILCLLKDARWHLLASAAVVALCWLLAGCAASREAAQETAAPTYSAGGAAAGRPDSLHYSIGMAPRPPDSVVVQPHRTLLDKALGRYPAPATYAGPPAVRAGKKATITIYNAPATVTTAGKKATLAGAGAVLTGKKAGGVARADSGATAVLSAGGIAQAGTGNVATMPKEEPKPTGWQRLTEAVAGAWRWLRWPLGIVAVLAAVAAAWAWLAPASGVGSLLLALWSRRKPTDTPPTA